MLDQDIKTTGFKIYEFTGHNIRQRLSDGYFNATDMCKIKKNIIFSNYLHNIQTKAFIKDLRKNICENSDGEIMILIDNIQTGSYKQGIWVHPNIANNLAIWISPIFAIKVSKWIEEWRLYYENNRKEYFEKVEESFKSNQKEIQLYLKQLYNGIIERKTDMGEIDLLYTNENGNYIMEIKSFSNWKYALGQILCYGEYYPNYNKVIYLFDVDNDVDENIFKFVKDIFNKYNIELRLHI